ncbi:MAG: hypothetical protein IPP88_03660 [Betaproteobacteria bacterium]|nr:hypothetical protein [Betaproteobacteria bacterium]
MSNLWHPIDPSCWEATPSIAGRAATEGDVKNGIAVFYIQGHSEPIDMQLPRAAIQKLEDGSTQPVVVIQAEQGPSGVILGIRPLQGGNGVCLEDEVQYVSNFVDG